jgi:hypothetical protein
VAQTIYRYELRRGDEILATGHLTNEESFEAGQPIKIGKREGVIHTVSPVLGESALRIVVQLSDDS